MKLTIVICLFCFFFLFNGCGFFEIREEIRKEDARKRIEKQCQKQHGKNCLLFRDRISLYIAYEGKLFTSKNHIIFQIDPENGKQSFLAGSVHRSFFGEGGHKDGPAEKAEFNYISGMVAHEGDLYISESGNNRIRTMNLKTGVVGTLAGDGTEGWRDGLGLQAQFNRPHDIVTDGVYLFVADFRNHAIRKIDLAKGGVTTLAGNGNSGWSDGTGMSASFNYPYGLALVGQKLFVAEYYYDPKMDDPRPRTRTLRQIDVSTGETSTYFGPDIGFARDIQDRRFTFNQWMGISADDQFLYFAGKNTIKSLNVQTGAITVIAGQENSKEWTDGIDSEARFIHPGIIINSENFLYIYDSYESYHGDDYFDYKIYGIRKLNKDTGKVETLWKAE